MSFLADVGRGTVSEAAACAIEGRDVLDLRDFSGASRFAAAGLNGVGTGDVETGVVGESTVRDFFNGTGLGAMMGAGVLLNCHRSNTDALRGRSLSLSGVAVVEVGALAGTDPCGWLFARTMFCTNPRPCSLLMLGVGSFAGGGRKNAGEAFCPSGICGPCSDFLGIGWMGFAKPGVLPIVGDLGDEKEGEAV